ncbi:hypothetical protein [Sagittula sp. SSi028]|uniref:hypothetical protein n=1 Tax=Sagittula sp. SSi028 TaxID=3400636 RepID=UPI003AF822A3
MIEAKSVVPFESIHVHGDNIVECERALSLITQALGHDLLNISWPNSSVACPRYELEIRGSEKPLVITFFPGFGRWDHDILNSIRDRGGVLREAADVIVTAVESGAENPLFAIEFCGALPAGNQAWQRSGRAFSFGAAKVPYLYISELGGFELDADRNRKAARLPNPAVPFSYLSFSIERDTPVFPIFITAPGADEASRQHYADEFADDELVQLVRAHLTGQDDADIFERLQAKVLSFVKKRASASRQGETLSSDQWQIAFDRVEQPIGVSGFLTDTVKQNWAKTAYISALTERSKALMQLGKKYGVGLTSTKLPMCIISAKARKAFSVEVGALFPELDAKFATFLESEKPLAICWVMGFKPGGDDARPDRGLPPLTRMLIGEQHEMMTVVYGPAPPSTWSTLVKRPGVLADRNGLWEAIMETSDALLVDASTDNVSKKGYLRSEWVGDLPTLKIDPFLVQPAPNKLGENDVDTALHLLLSQLSGPNIFEGMCNPPGGDWSGVSIVSPDGGTEYRWLSLPRVSGADKKRPDHVFQITDKSLSPDIILSIESKELPAGGKGLEDNIGPRLTAYLHYLFATPANVERATSTTAWQHSQHLVTLDGYRYASAGAFIYTTEEQTLDAVNRSETDLIFAVNFEATGLNCDIKIYCSTKLGKIVADYIIKSAVESDIISISRAI